jgi:hypothetical protein
MSLVFCLFGYGKDRLYCKHKKGTLAKDGEKHPAGRPTDNRSQAVTGSPTYAERGLANMKNM